MLNAGYRSIRYLIAPGTLDPAHRVLTPMSLDLPGIFLAGLLTFLSPCVLPLIPLYLSFIAGVSIAELREGSGGLRKPVLAALAFSLGLTVVFVTLGMVATAVGGVLTEHRVTLLQFGGLALLLLGLKQLGVIQIPWLDRESRPWMGRIQSGGNVVGAFLFGAAFALGWTPCIGPVLGGVLTYTSAATSNPVLGATYLGTYAAGLSLPLIAVAFAAPSALRWMDKAKRHIPNFEKATGALLVVMGVLLFTDSLGALVPSAGPTDVATVATADAAASPAATSGASCDVDSGGSGTCAVPDAGGFTAAAGASVLARVDRPTMVEFVSQTCTVCQRMEPLVSLVTEACDRNGVDVLRLDVGTQDGRIAAAEYGVRGVPTFVFLDGVGQEAMRQIGEQTLASLEQGLGAIAEGGCAGADREG